MEFKKYNSIENTYRTGYLDKIRSNGANAGKFCVKEKIHGNNFSIQTNGEEFIYAKRNGLIEEGEYFSGYSLIVAEIKPDILRLVEYLKDSKEEDVEITLYGELFGGSYPHPDVTRDNKASRVQKGVHYHPSTKILFYDMKINGGYISNSWFDFLMIQFNIPYIPTLLTGTFEECLNYPNEFQTTIPTEIYNLPEIENNTCEGVVIKPVEPIFIGESRVILKNKNEKFAESKQEPKRERKPQEEFSEEACNIIDILMSFLVENRLRNIVSHLGDITEKDFVKILCELNKDIWNEFNKDEDSVVAMNLLVKEEQKRISKHMNSATANFIRCHFLAIIDGVF